MSPSLFLLSPIIPIHTVIVQIENVDPVTERDSDTTVEICAVLEPMFEEGVEVTLLVSTENDTAGKMQGYIKVLMRGFIIIVNRYKLVECIIIMETMHIIITCICMVSKTVYKKVEIV